MTFGSIIPHWFQHVDRVRGERELDAVRPRSSPFVHLAAHFCRRQPVTVVARHRRADGESHMSTLTNQIPISADEALKGR